ncbi:MAG: hypothetical protein ACRD6N_19300, partial [Pyrinomonadaceae bacterium]
VSIKPGVERSGTPGSSSEVQPAKRAAANDPMNRHSQHKLRNKSLRALSPVSRALLMNSFLSWGSAALHPRLYDSTRFAGF